MVKKLIFIIIIKKLLKNNDLVLLNKVWCKWSNPDLNKPLFLFNLIKLIDKNSNTKIEIDHASKIGWANFSLARYINKNDITKPNNKLPLSPKNNFGNFKKEKLKHKNNNTGNNNIVKNCRT